MANVNYENLWDFFYAPNKYAFVKVPTCLMWEIMNGEISLTETKVLLFICRMSYGYKKRQDTCPLDLEDFEKSIHVAKPHISKAITVLISKGMVLRYKKSGDMYQYAINLKRYGVENEVFKGRKAST